MKTPLRIMITPYCANDCRICCFSGESTLSMQNIPKEAAKNLSKAFSNEKIDVTGKDPLKNMPFLKETVQFHKGEKAIVLNPLSFLTLEHEKAGRDITKDDALKSIENYERTGLAQKAYEIVNVLKDYDKIRVSSGSLQAPYPETALLANLYFERGVKPFISDKVFYNYLNNAHSIHCIGSFRNEGIPEKKRFTKADVCGDAGYTLSFLENELRIHACCTVGMSDHISSYSTGIKLEDIAGSNPKELRNEIKNAHKEYKKTGLYNLLNPKFPIKLSYKKLENRFSTLCFWTNDFLREHNEEQVTHVKTNTIKATVCETCHTLALYLKRAGISPQEYQSYIDERFKTEMK